MPLTKINPDLHREETSERLRIVLPLLSKHASDFGPESYALWFGFVTADRPNLVRDLEHHVARGTRLSVDQTALLYCRHLRDAEVETMESVRDGFVELLTQIATSTDEAQAAALRGQQAMQAVSLTAAAVSIEAAERVESNRRHVVEHSQLIAAALLTFGQQLDTAKNQVRELREELQNVRSEARTDALTKLNNRRSFDEALSHCAEQARAHGRPLALIMIDVDNFKRFNDELGHVMGDKALAALARAIQQNVKGRDFAARYGGEEFAVLLPDTSATSARQVAENLREAIERIRIRKVISGEALRAITISCGVSVLRPAEGLTDFVDRADGALYLAKQAGRNRVFVAVE